MWMANHFVELTGDTTLRPGAIRNRPCDDARRRVAVRPARRLNKVVDPIVGTIELGRRRTIGEYVGVIVLDRAQLLCSPHVNAG